MAQGTNTANPELFAAIEAQSVDGIRAALAKGADPNAKRARQKALDVAFRRRVPDEGIHAMIDAGAEVGTEHIAWAATQPLPILEKFLAAGVNVNAESFAGRPVQVAARAGLLPQVERLLAADADPNLGTMIGNALTDAITQGHTAVALALLKGGASVEAASAFGPMLPMVIEMGDVAVAVAMVNAANDVDARATLRGPHTLEKLREAKAARQKLGASFKAIVDAGAALGAALSGAPSSSKAEEEDDDFDDEESFDDFQKRIDAEIAAKTEVATRVRFSGATPLMVASAEGLGEVVEALIARGASVNLTDEEGRTALAIAEAAGHSQVAARLRKAGGVEQVALPPEQALMLAVDKGDPSGIEAARRAGANLDALDTRKATDGRTALILAAERGRLDLVRALLKLGADPAVKARTSPHNMQAMVDNISQERTALHAAAAAGHDKVVTALIDAGAAIEAKDERGETPLFLAAANDCRAAVRVLIQRGAQVNLKGDDNMTPLLYAAARGHSETGLALLAAGADPLAASKERETALHWAVGSKAAPLIRELIERGADPLAKNQYGATPKERGQHIKAVAALFTRARKATGGAKGGGKAGRAASKTGAKTKRTG